MSIVKYTNKKTGVVTLYESTSHYDPITKQSRPVRKYLGKEDPVTGELIPSTGKRGRKKSESGPAVSSSYDPDTASVLSRLEEEISSRDTIIKDQASTIKRLETEKASVITRLSSLLTELSR